MTASLASKDEDAVGPNNGLCRVSTSWPASSKTDGYSYEWGCHRSSFGISRGSKKSAANQEHSTGVLLCVRGSRSPSCVESSQSSLLRYRRSLNLFKRWSLSLQSEHADLLFLLTIYIYPNPYNEKNPRQWRMMGFFSAATNYNRSRPTWRSWISCNFQEIVAAVLRSPWNRSSEGRLGRPCVL